MKRALLLLGCCATLFCCAFLSNCGGGNGGGGNPPPPPEFPVSGPNVAGVTAYDNAIIPLLQRYNIPGAAVAVTKNGKLVLARGYGYSDRDTKTLMQPDAIFRIASISKPITAVAILHLVEQGRLSLDTPFLNILTQYTLPSNADPRLSTITIRNLVQHSGGWDRDSTHYDPMFDSVHIASALGVPAPATCSDVIQYMLGRPLDFDPGTKYVYSNFGYCVLGRVIERVTGQSYEVYVRDNVLAPMDIHAMRIGKSLADGRVTGEVKYHDYNGAPTVPSVFPSVTTPVPMPYGGFYLEAMDSHGGWIASAIDLTRFITAVDGARGTAFLSPASITAMTERPNIPSWQGSSYWYGLGIMYRPQTTGGNWWHTGALSGTSTLLVRNYQGYTWAILMNSRPQNTTNFDTDVDQTMWTALGNGLEGSATDLYTQFPSPNLPPSTGSARSGKSVH